MHIAGVSSEVILVLHVLVFIINLIEHELLLVLHEELRGSLHVDKQPVHLLDIGHIHLRALTLCAHQGSRDDHVDRVSQRRLHGDSREQVLGVLRHLHVFFFAADRENLAHLVLRVRLGRDDHQSIKQIDRDAVRRLVVGATDARDAAVRGDDQHRRHVALQRSVEPRKALDIEHVHLVNEQHARHDRRLAFFTPLGDLLVDLLAHFVLNLARVTSKQRQEALRARVDHVDLVERHDVDHLLALLQLSLGTLHESRLRAHGVVVSLARERATKLRDLARLLVDRDHIASFDLLLRQRVDHLGAQIVHRLHLRRAQRQAADLVAHASTGRVHLHLHNLALNDLGLLHNTDTNRSSEGLRERLGLAHLEREHLATSDGRERRVLA